MSSSKSDARFVVRPQTAGHAVAVEKLLDSVLGPGRFAKASYRLREGVEAIGALAFVAEHAVRGPTHLAGSIRYWPIEIGPNGAGRMTRALLLGPLAVPAHLQGQGVGLALMRTSLRKAADLGHRLVVLVGDLPYYERVGFSPIPTGRAWMPQPCDPQRLLWRALVTGAADGVSGAIKRYQASPDDEAGRIAP